MKQPIQQAARIKGEARAEEKEYEDGAGIDQDDLQA
jgi:hypothetical protein